MSLFDKCGHWHGMGECLEDLARLRASSGKLMEALFHIRHAIELFERDGDRAAIVCAGASSPIFCTSAPIFPRRAA